MADADDSSTLQQRSDSLQGRYRLRFANKPRATRDLSEMDRLIEVARELVDEAERLGEAVSEELRTTLDERLSLYRGEREAIVEAREAGQAYFDAALLGTRANFAIARYQRHFASQSRPTRDLGLLDELVEELETIQQRMARVLVRERIEELERDLETVTRNLELYRQEREAIEQVQRQGEPQERISLLATLANQQFALYRVHFAGSSRLTRRPAFLERILGELRRIEALMRALSEEGHAHETHEGNRSNVRRRIELYDGELRAIREARASRDVLDLLDAIGRESDQLMQTYNEEFAGRDRSDRDLDRMSLLCDEMGELERQMTELVERYDLDPQHGDLGAVRDALVLFEDEYRRIAEAKLH